MSEAFDDDSGAGSPQRPWRLAGPAFAQKTVTIVREIDTDRYDPQKSTSRSGAEVMYMMGDTLVNLDYDMKTAEAGPRHELDGLAGRPHLHLQAARRRHLLLAARR